MYFFTFWYFRITYIYISVKKKNTHNTDMKYFKSMLHTDYLETTKENEHNKLFWMNLIY